MEFGYLHFDAFLPGLLTTFVVSNIEGWVDLHYGMNDGTSGDLRIVLSLFCYSLVLISSMFVANLAMAVVWDQYAAADEERRSKEEAALAEDLAKQARDHAIQARAAEEELRRSTFNDWRLSGDFGNLITVHDEGDGEKSEGEEKSKKANTNSGRASMGMAALLVGRRMHRKSSKMILKHKRLRGRWTKAVNKVEHANKVAGPRGARRIVGATGSLVAEPGSVHLAPVLDLLQKNINRRKRLGNKSALYKLAVKQANIQRKNQGRGLSRLKRAATRVKLQTVREHPVASVVPSNGSVPTPTPTLVPIAAGIPLTEEGDKSDGGSLLQRLKRTDVKVQENTPKNRPHVKFNFGGVVQKLSPELADSRVERDHRSAHSESHGVYVKSIIKHRSCADEDDAWLFDEIVEFHHEKAENDLNIAYTAAKTKGGGDSMRTGFTFHEEEIQEHLQEEGRKSMSLFADSKCNSSHNDNNAAAIASLSQKPKLKSALRLKSLWKHKTKEIMEQNKLARESFHWLDQAKRVIKKKRDDEKAGMLANWLNTGSSDDDDDDVDDFDDEGGAAATSAEGAEQDSKARYDDGDDGTEKLTGLEMLAIRAQVDILGPEEVVALPQDALCRTKDVRHMLLENNENSLSSLADIEKRKKKELKQMRKKERAALRLTQKLWWNHPTVRACYLLVKSDAFYYGMMAVIFSNTLVLTLTHYGQSKEFESALEWANSAFLLFFGFELLIKLWGLGLKRYVHYPLNVIDALVVFSGIAEIVYMCSISSPSAVSIGVAGSSSSVTFSDVVAEANNTDTNSTTASTDENLPAPAPAVLLFPAAATCMSVGHSALRGLPALRSLRIMRVIRILKVAEAWRNLFKMLETIMQALSDVVHSSFLLFLFLFLMSILGNSLFGGRMKWYYYGDSLASVEPYAHFDTWWWGFVAVFQVTCGGEDWNRVMFNTIHAVAQAEEEWTHPIIAILFYVVLIIVGQYLILNLFLAILLSNFVPSEFEDQIEEFEEEMGIRDHTSKSHAEMDRHISIATKRKTETSSSPYVVQVSHDSTATEEEDEFAVQTRPRKFHYYNARATSLGYLGGYNKFRRFCFGVIDHRYFEGFIMFIVAVSCIGLVFDQPVYTAVECPGGADTTPSGVSRCTASAVGVLLEQSMSMRTKILNGINWFVSTIFLLEMVLKILALGLVAHKGAYLRDKWNIFDGTLVVLWLVLTVVGFLGGHAWLRNLSGFFTVRILRALKPLRLVKKFPGLRQVVNTILMSVPRMVAVLFIFGFFGLIFAIVGQTLWMGSLRHCNDISVRTKAECTGAFNLTLEQCWFKPDDATRIACESWEDPLAREFPRVWENKSPWNFDNIGESTLTILIATSGETWPSMLYDVVNANGMDQPMLEMSEFWPRSTLSSFYIIGPIYFILLTLVCGFLLLNVIVGVIIDEFALQKEKEMNQMTSAARTQWLERKLLAAMHPVLYMERPNGFMWFTRDKFFDLVTHRRYEMAKQATIALNIVLILFHTSDMSEMSKGVIFVLEVFFASVFTFDCLFKLIAYGPGQYKDVPANLVDAAIIVCTWIYIGSVEAGSTFRYQVLGATPILRIMRLVELDPKLLTLVNTGYYAFPYLMHVMFMYVLTYFVGATFCMYAFSHVKRGRYLNDHANFDDFFVSFRTLFRCSTGEGYNTIMNDLRVQAPYCNDAVAVDAARQAGASVVPEMNCGNVWFPPIFFNLFYILQQYYMLNIMVAVILDVFAETNQLALVIAATEHMFTGVSGVSRVSASGKAVGAKSKKGAMSRRGRSEMLKR